MATAAICALLTWCASCCCGQAWPLELVGIASGCAHEDHAHGLGAADDGLHHSADQGPAETGGHGGHTCHKGGDQPFAEAGFAAPILAQPTAAGSGLSTLASRHTGRTLSRPGRRALRPESIPLLHTTARLRL